MTTGIKSTYEGLVDWMSEKPRFQDWGAVLAFDRSRTNIILMQQYIENFGQDSYSDVIDEVIEDTAGVSYCHLYNLKMDSPRLSFENSSLQNGMVTMTMRVIGGSQLNWLKSFGGKFQVVKVYDIDALDGPKLTSNLFLQESEFGTVGDDGVVKIDISKATKYDFSSLASVKERERVGQRLQQVFSNYDPQYREFILSKIESKEGSYVDPERFYLRTHPRAGAATFDSGTFGEGAIVIFIAMRNELSGTIPADNDGMPYLIPDGHSASMFFSNKFMMFNIFAKGVELVNNVEDFAMVTLNLDPSGFISTTEVSKGALKLPLAINNSSLPHFSQVSVDEIILPMNSGPDADRFNFADFNLDFYENVEPVALWIGMTNIPMVLTLRGDGPERTFNHNFKLGWGVTNGYKFELVQDEHGINRLQLTESHKPYLLWFALAHEFANIPEVMDHWEEVADCIVQELKPFIGSHLENSLPSPIKDIDLFRLNNIIFQKDNIFKLDRVDFYGSLFMAGSIGEALSAFAVEPLEDVVAAGGKIEFKTSPPREDLDWTVENIDNFGGAGTISAAGVYTAPAISDMKGSFTRVRVTATTQDGNFRNSALISVVKREITINPLVMACDAQVKDGHEITAGALSDGELVWKVESLSGDIAGEITLPDNTENRLYFPGKLKPDSTEAFTFDKITVTNAKVPSQSESSYVLNMFTTPVLALRVDTTREIKEGSVPFYVVTNENKEFRPGDAGWSAMSFNLVHGSGTFDIKDGTYKYDVNTTDRFAIITVTLDAVVTKLNGFIIIPFPLTDFPYEAIDQGENATLNTQPTADEKEHKASLSQQEIEELIKNTPRNEALLSKATGNLAKHKRTTGY